MSSRAERSADWTGWLLLLLTIAAGIWYAQNQVIYSLMFMYQLLRFVLG